MVTKRAAKAPGERRASPRKRPAPVPFVGKHLSGRGKLSSKGWVVIPKEIRDEMGLKQGDEVRFSLVPPVPAMKQDRGLYALRVHRVPEDPPALGHGMFPRKPGEASLTEELLRERRLDVEREERKIRRDRGHRRPSP